MGGSLSLSARPQGRQMWPPNVFIPRDQPPVANTLPHTKRFQHLIILRTCHQEMTMRLSSCIE